MKTSPINLSDYLQEYRKEIWKKNEGESYWEKRRRIAEIQKRFDMNLLRMAISETPKILKEKKIKKHKSKIKIDAETNRKLQKEDWERYKKTPEYDLSNAFYKLINYEREKKKKVHLPIQKGDKDINWEKLEKFREESKYGK